eukprot:3877366-Ditylum_brightwellii.AAC.1
MTFYLCVVRPPSIKDYWDIQQYMPDHQIAKKLDLNMQAEEKAGMSDEDDKEEGTLYDESVECIMHDEDGFDEENENEEDKETETESEDDDETPPKVWYYKLKHLIDHVRDASAALIWILRTCLALYEMM